MRSVRLSTALVIAAFATILTAGGALAGVPTPPEAQTGSVGPYLIRDSFGSTAASCDYPDTGGLVLKAIIVKAPEVRWADTDSNNDNEHGKIAHRIVIQRSNDNGVTWTKLKSSTRQVAAATESAAANLTKRTVSISVNGNKPLLRVYSKIQWIRPNGTVRGTLKHWYAYSRWTSDQLQGTIEPGPCHNVLAS